MIERPDLIVFAGLPGTGKSTLARALAGEIGAVYLRIDSVEDGLHASRLPLGDDLMDSSYQALWRVAADNLGLGLTVIADNVNPVGLTRQGWAGVAHRTGSRLIDVEVLCSDTDAHRARIARRHANGIGPDWASVTARPYHSWSTGRLVIDTAGAPPEVCVQEILAKIQHLS